MLYNVYDIDLFLVTKKSKIKSLTLEHQLAAKYIHHRKGNKENIHVELVNY